LGGARPENSDTISSVPDHDVSDRATWGIQHPTFLACDSAAADYLTPIFTKSKCIFNDIWSHRFGQYDIKLRVGQPAYIDEAIFSEHVSRALPPYIKLVRRKLEFAREKAGLLMDLVGAHVAADVLVLLGHCNTTAIVFPAHTITILQASDLLLISAFRIRRRTAQGDFCSQAVKDHIAKVLCAYEEALCQLQHQRMFGQSRFYSR
jgi:hypothetical protein